MPRLNRDCLTFARAAELGNQEEPTTIKTTTLFWHETGPLLNYTDGTLHIGSLNPDLHASWRMTRMEMLITGWRFIVAALLS